MSEPWPPSSPNVKKDFENANTQSIERTQSKEQPPIITKELLEQMEQQRKKLIPELELTPPGTQKKTVDDEHERRYQKLRQRFIDSSARAREKFSDQIERGGP